jgi:prephenate dehydratase
MLKIAVLGPTGTFTEKAAMKYLDAQQFSGELNYYTTLRKTFDAIGTECDLGVIPIENTLDGFVQIILDFLTHSDLNIIHEIVLPIRFAFVSNCKDISHVKKVYTQFKSQNQCYDFLDKLTGVSVITTASNSESYALIRQGVEFDGAIIPMHLLEEGMGFETVIENVADSIDNETRFIILAKEPNREKKNTAWKTLLVIHDDSDRPGLLVDILNIFSDEGINLKSIFSRPTKKGLGNYNFFIDVEGCYQKDEHVKRAVQTVTQNYKVRVLGSYYRV